MAARGRSRRTQLLIDLAWGRFYACEMCQRENAFDSIDEVLEPLRLKDRVYSRHPDHPGVLHYLIHAYDDPQHAQQGLKAARAYANAPDDIQYIAILTSFGITSGIGTSLPGCEFRPDPGLAGAERGAKLGSGPDHPVGGQARCRRNSAAGKHITRLPTLVRNSALDAKTRSDQRWEDREN